jgi:outer membrane protein insertion porin family
MLLAVVPAWSATVPDGLTISSVDVAGNVTLTRAEVLSVVRARPGRAFDVKMVAEDTERITQQEAVESSYYNTKIENNQVALTYVVVERNLVRTIAFKGNKKLSDRLLAKELSYKRGDYLDVFAVRAGVDGMVAKYKKKGYPWVDIKVDENTLMLGNIVYNIDEGARPKIKGIEFSGNDSFSARALKKVIKTKKKKLLLFSAYYDPDLVAEDTQKLLAAYQKKSFLDAHVTHRVEFKKDKTRAYIIFDIQEGPAYMVNTISIVGNSVFTEEDLRTDLKLREDYFYSEGWAEFDTKKIRAKYGEKGYVEARVKQNRTFLPDARVKIEFEIEEGDRYRIGEVVIAGNESIKDHAIRRILDEENFMPGEWYNADIARGDGEGELERIVRQSAVTQSTIITPTGNEPGERDALVSIKEGQTGSVMLGAGVASDSGLIGQISLDQRNFDITDTPSSFKDIFTGKAFRGAGQRFRISLNPGTEVSTYLVSWTEPFLYDKPVSWNVSTSSFERGRETYDEGRLAFKTSLEKRYQNRWRRGVSLRVEDVEIDDLDWDAPDEVIEDEGSNLIMGTRFYIRKDTTDSRYLPSRGINFDAGYEQVFGDHTFGVLEGTYRWYKTLHEDLAENKTVLETKVHAGTVIGDAPVFELFYAGGTNSIRGFKYRGVSPRGGPSDEPIGSDWIVTSNAEVAVPMGSETFAWLFFGDAGMVEEGGVRTAIGTGIQIMIPQWFGPVPMRFELAAPLTKDDLDDTQAFSFSMGALF